MAMSSTSFPRILEAIRSHEPAGQPHRLFAAVDAAIDKEVGRIFCTYLLLHANGDGERVYTTVPREYPNGGRKPLQGTDWGDHVLKAGKIFLSGSLEELRRTYATHDVVEALGCGALANIPVIYDGEVLGTINLGQSLGRYTEQRLEDLRPYAALLGPAFALLRLKGSQA